MTASDRTTDAESTAEPLRVLAVTTYRPAEIVNSVGEMGSEIEVISFDHEIGLPSRAIQTVRETRRRLRSHDPDVLLLDCFEVMGVLVTLLAMWYDVPVVARLVGDTWRAFDEEGAQSAWQNGEYGRWARCSVALLLDEFVFDRAVGFVAVSEELKQVIHRRTGCPSERIGVVPVPVTTDTRSEGSATEARQIHEIGQERVLLTVTNLKFRPKLAGVERTVDELRPVLESNPDLAYVIAGGGSNYEELVRYLDTTVEDPSVRERIRALGFVDDVADLYAMADVFVYVSYRDGYPNVVLEAQTAGLPVVANDAHGMREQIADGESGYLVDPAESGAVRDRVERLLTDPDLRRRLGDAARERVRRENTPEAVSRRLEAFLVDLLGEIEATHR